MIKELDLSLKNLLTQEAATGSELANANISFSVPDATWRGQGAGLELDVYLYQVFENRELRSNERRLRHDTDGTVTVEQFPTRIECSYVLTAWNKATNVIGDDREKQEHRLLSQVLYVLQRNPVIPRTYLTTALASQELDLPLVSAQPDGSALAPDFWSALETYVRPAILCNVTLALDLRRDVVGPPATTVEIRVDGERRYLIGGTVTDSATPPTPVGSAWVFVQETGRTYVSDADGHFRIDGLGAGSYTLSVRAVGFEEASRGISVPQPDGIYDVRLLKLP